VGQYSTPMVGQFSMLIDTQLCFNWIMVSSSV
jgi:hypothetical protein